MKSIAEMRACSMTDIELAMMLRQGDDRDKRIARCELAGRGYQTYAGISLRDPENGNGKVAPEEVKRAQEEIKMSNQQNRSSEQIKLIKQNMKKMSDNQLRPIFLSGGDRQLSTLAYAELSARFNMLSVYEVTALIGDKVVNRYLKRVISREYVDGLMNGCDEVRIRKVEIE